MSGWGGVQLDCWYICLCYLPLAPENPEDGVQNMIVRYHPVGAPTCVCKQEVGKPSQNAAQLCANADGCVHEEVRADKLLGISVRYLEC